jgi:dTDP-4-dehydrorhamnose 3,5-epimerase
MLFEATKLKDAYLIKLQKIADERGYFARSWCKNEFHQHGLDANLVQCNVSFNHSKGALRGMHYQSPPDAETKLVRCTRGAIFDVIIDLRPDSPSYLQWFGATLTPENGDMLYIPKGFAHGFQTLTDNSEIFYQMSDFYAPQSAKGVRWNDPFFNIQWPLTPTVLSDKDRALPDVAPEQFAELCCDYDKKPSTGGKLPA